MTASVIIPTIHADDAMLDCCIKLVKEALPEPQLGVCDGGTFAQNCNEGAKLAYGDVIVFLNDDTEPKPNWLDELLKPFSDESIGVVGSRLTYPDGTLQHAGIYLTAEPGWNAHNHQTEQYEVPAHAVTGACLAIRRSLFEAIGGFNEDYRNGAEDVELCLQAWQRGYKVWYTPWSNVIHHESQSGEARWTHVQQNVALFRSRWHFEIGVTFVGDGTGNP